MSDIFFAGAAMMLIFEGVMPLFAPRVWREAFTRIMGFTDGQLRFAGLMSVAAGAALLGFALR